MSATARFVSALMPLHCITPRLSALTRKTPTVTSHHQGQSQQFATVYMTANWECVSSNSLKQAHHHQEFIFEGRNKTDTGTTSLPVARDLLPSAKHNSSWSDGADGEQPGKSTTAFTKRLLEALTGLQ